MCDEEEILSRIETINYFGEEVAPREASTLLILPRKDSATASSATSGADQDSFELLEPMMEEIQVDLDKSIVSTVDIVPFKIETVQLISPEKELEREEMSRIVTATFWSEEGLTAETSQPLLVREISQVSSRTSGADEEQNLSEAESSATSGADHDRLFKQSFDEEPQPTPSMPPPRPSPPKLDQLVSHRIQIDLATSKSISTFPSLSQTIEPRKTKDQEIVELMIIHQCLLFHKLASVISSKAQWKKDS
ncbi:unnamed protein product, partial [Mesorhabditis belari]|uniref:Uncharacterized protein n=1 Tax=Mesorhabditis belari TaxID=2138241 RepID=A0AAF3FQE3_9BILA